MDITPEFLEAQRALADSEADALVGIIIGAGKQHEFNELLENLLYNGSMESIKQHLPDNLRQYYTAPTLLPPWFDPERAQRGQKVFTEYGIEICIILLCKSLPECYACWRGAHVLYETKRLDMPGAIKTQKNVPPRLTKRVMETLQFVLNVMAEDGFASEGKGIVTAGKIRLIHAAIRCYAKQKRWDTALYGEPINQEDMAITLTTFSSSIVSGLRMLGITLDAEQIDGYMHCWEVIGHIMGLHDGLIPATYDDSVALHFAILEHQAGSTKENAELTQTCIDFIEYIMPKPFQWFFTGIAPLFVQMFVDERAVQGKNLSNILNVRTPSGFFSKLKFYLVKGIFVLFGWFQQKGVLLKWLVGALGTTFIQGMVYANNDYKQVQFDIPLSLTDSWDSKRRFRKIGHRKNKNSNGHKHSKR